MKQSSSSQRIEEETLVSRIDHLLGIRIDENDPRETFKIGDLARQFDTTLRTLRFYEDRGLLNPRRQGTTRLYTRRDRMRLRLILLGKALGFSLTEAKQIIDSYDQPDGTRKQLEMALKRFEEQREILLEQQREIERSLEVMDVALDIVREQLR